MSIIRRAKHLVMFLKNESLDCMHHSDLGGQLGDNVLMCTVNVKLTCPYTNLEFTHHSLSFLIHDLQIISVLFFIYSEEDTKSLISYLTVIKRADCSSSVSHTLTNLLTLSCQECRTYKSIADLLQKWYKFFTVSALKKKLRNLI